MQETRNNCFGLKISSMTLRQAKTGKHKFQNITVTYIAIQNFDGPSVIVLLTRFPTQFYFNFFTLQITSVILVYFLIHLFHYLSLQMNSSMHLSVLLWIVWSFLKVLLLLSKFLKNKLMQAKYINQKFFFSNKWGDYF